MKFWRRHLFIPLLVLLPVLLAAELSNLDLWVADRWFAAEGNHWALRNHWITYDLIHHLGKQAVIAFGLLLVALLALSSRVPRLRPLRWPLGYALLAMMLVPSLIAGLKHFSPVPCPWDLQRYGGELVYQHTFTHTFGATAVGHCFPAGHASGGFALLSLYFATLPWLRKPVWMLLPGLLVGTIFALGQQARGAHFLSHDLWTLAACWLLSLGLYLVFSPKLRPSLKTVQDHDSP